jgi:Protein of unknown function (DUF2934)
MIDPRFQVQLPRSPSKHRNPASQEKQSAISVAINTVSDDEIRVYAHELYERRGGTEDRAIEDWLAAESYLAARKNRANKVIG